MENFEFFRNTALDARGYFDSTRPEFIQNQFGVALGGPLGGPAGRSNLFFFADYQGTRKMQRVSTGNISVPTVAECSGTFLSRSGGSSLTGCLNGPYFASLLSEKLGSTVSANDPYSEQFLCTALEVRGSAVVFPEGVIPPSVFSSTGKKLLGYIPVPNVNANQFSTSAFAQTNRDDKGWFRLDADTRLGRISGYYFTDKYTLFSP